MVTRYCTTHRLLAEHAPTGTVAGMDAPSARLTCQTATGEHIDPAAAIAAVYAGDLDPDAVSLALTVDDPPSLP